MMQQQAERARVFRALHERPRAFVIPNPWDVGTARLLARLGFEALATTSGGHAFASGRADNTLTRDETMAHAAIIAEATDLPVSGDLGNGFGETPEAAAEAIRLAAATGLVGASIEDATYDSDRPILPAELAKERITAAAEAARALPFPFTLTARAENYLVGRKDIADTIARLQAFQEAGADVLYAPGLATRDEVIAVVRSVDRPVNVVMGLVGVQMSVADLSTIGVRRISTGTSLARAALGAFLRAAEEIRDDGTFGYASTAVSYKEINELLGA
jgi:2-methylisocitrate lyase-like PEP mutase family enzyme